MYVFRYIPLLAQNRSWLNDLDRVDGLGYYVQSLTIVEDIKDISDMNTIVKMILY